MAARRGVLPFICVHPRSSVVVYFSMSSSRKPVLLVIRDGWGKNPDAAQNATNAVYLAKKACDDALHARYPHALDSRHVGRREGRDDVYLGRENAGLKIMGYLLAD